MSELQEIIGADGVQQQSDLGEVKHGALAWVSESLPEDAGIIPLDKACLKELMEVACTLHANPLPLAALRPEDFDMPICRDLMRYARETLETGVGFIIIDRLPMEELDSESATRRYWLLGNMISRAGAQKWDGTMKYDVRDTGKSMSPGNGVRASLTNKALQQSTLELAGQLHRAIVRPTAATGDKRNGNATPKRNHDLPACWVANRRTVANASSVAMVPKRIEEAGNEASAPPYLRKTRNPANATIENSVAKTVAAKISSTCPGRRSARVGFTSMICGYYPGGLPHHLRSVTLKWMSMRKGLPVLRHDWCLPR